MRTQARAVVIGGGVGGASILYWLARLGWTDTMLVERSRATSGSTFHSAGLVGQLRQFVNVYLNDEDVRLGAGLAAKVSEKDEISIVPAVAGGS